MGKVVLFAAPKVDPARPWFPTEGEIQRFGHQTMQELQDLREISRQIDTRIRENVAVLVSVLGMTQLAELCVECASREIVELAKRPDVYAVLDAFNKGKAAAKREVV
jgi:hypothetical protein